MKRFLLPSLLLLAAGCASSSIAVPADAPRTEATFVAPEDSIYYTAQRVFVAEGFALDQTDRAAGRIETEARHVAAVDAGLSCDDGARGADVSFIAQVDGAVLVLRTIVEGGACRSTGAIEEALFARMRASLGG